MLLRRPSTGRHAASRARRARAGRAAVAAVTLAATLPLALSSSAPAHAVESCPLTPQLSEVMVNQGLPSYKQFLGDGKPENKLVRGKTTLVKYFLRLPSCAPDTADVRVVSGQLFTTISPARIDAQGKLVLPAPEHVLAATTPTGTLPAPPVGPTATAPVAEAASDPLFVVPGSALKPGSPEMKRVYFAAVLQYTVDGGDVQTLNLLTLPGSGDLVSRVIDIDVRPLRALVVPMGDGGTVRSPNTYESQFPDAARTEVERGLQALSRVLPVPDYAGEPLTATSAGLRAGLSDGLLTLGDHVENGRTVNYMPNGSDYCGSLSHFTYISSELQKRRTAHNSVNPSQQAEFAYGVIWQDRSLGATTGTTDPTCVEGAGAVPGRTAWGRLVAPVQDGRPGVTGTIAAMELVHNAGAVDEAGSRYVPGYHSKNTEADVTAVDRAWNTLERKWISQDRSVMSEGFSGWNDSNSLLEVQDWDAFHCLLTSDKCATGATIGVGAAGASAGSFYLAGSFSGYDDDVQGNEQADVSSYYLKSGQAEPAAESSPYLFVQRAGEKVLSTQPIPISSHVDHHDHEGSGQVHSSEVFGVQLAAAADTDRVQIYRGSIAPQNLVYERVERDVPQFLSVSVANRTASVSATGTNPDDLRLDVFLSCPDMTSPLSVDLHPVVVGTVATFTTTYDTSLGCGDDGELLYRLNDGYSTRTDKSLNDTVGTAPAGGVAAIYAPTASAEVTQFGAVPLAGAGRDAAGLPADRLEWRLAPAGQPLPEQPSFVGGSGSLNPPGDGFTVGDYAVELRAFRGEVFLSEATSKVKVRPDVDRDLITDPIEPPCFDGAVSNPHNATRDSDFDGRADVVDVVDHDGDGLIDLLTEYEPCASIATAAVTFDPQKLQKGSSGVPVTVRLTSDKLDLLALKASGAQLFIHKIAGYAASIPAESWSVSLTLTGPVAEAKFSRDSVSKVLHAHGVLGYAPIFVGTADRSLYGADRQYPVVFP